MAQIRAFATPQDAISKAKFSKQPLLEFATHYLERMYEHGFYAIDNDYVTGKQRIVLNRSRGAESNFFVFMDISSSSVEVYFSDPRDSSEALDMKRESIIVRRSYDCGFFARHLGTYQDPKCAIEMADLALNLSKLKSLNDFRCFLHSHLGYINGKPIWDDGVTEDRNWIAQTMLWHGDVRALTSHNWTHDEEKLSFLDAQCSSANITFIPGWENTTTTNGDTFRVFHMIMLGANIGDMMEAKGKFLANKLKKSSQNVNEIVPMLSGVTKVPPSEEKGMEWTKKDTDYEQHLAYTKMLRDRKKAVRVLAHPAAAQGGIDLFDPANIIKLGFAKVKEIFESMDGVEQFNFLEGNKELDYESHEDKTGELAKFRIWLRLMLRQERLPESFSAMNINLLMGLLARKKGKFTTVGQDDHYEPPVTPDCIGDYSKGYTRMRMPAPMFKRMKRIGRKLSSEEFVSMMIGIPSAFSAEAFVKMTEHGPEVIKERMHTRYEKFKKWFSFTPKYYGHIIGKQLKYMLAAPKQKAEMAKELAKAKAYRVRPDIA